MLWPSLLCGDVAQDYASLFQHPPDGTRSEEEEALFKQGLAGLASLYAHPKTTVFCLTRMPADYPAAYDVPAGANCAAYEDRGWCARAKAHACAARKNAQLAAVA